MKEHHKERRPAEPEIRNSKPEIRNKFEEAEKEMSKIERDRRRDFVAACEDFGIYGRGCFFRVFRILRDLACFTNLYGPLRSFTDLYGPLPGWGGSEEPA